MLDAVVAGPQWGRVRAMHDFTGDRVQQAGPGMPVEVLGFDGVCEAGEYVQVVENDRRARQMAQERGNRLKTEALARRQARKVNLEEVFSRAQAGDIKELNLVLKADVAGSLEALQDEIAKVPQDQVAINVIHAQTGGINESDVMLASASDAVIIGFNVRPLSDARKAAETEGVDIAPTRSSTRSPRTCAPPWRACSRRSRSRRRSARQRSSRPSRRRASAASPAAWSATARSPGRQRAPDPRRHGDLDRQARIAAPLQGRVREVEEGQECGIVLDGYADVKEGDVLEFFQTKQVEQTLTSSAGAAGPVTGR